MLDMSLLEVGVIAIVALIVLGPERLPVVARKVGQWIKQWRSLIHSVEKEAKQAVNDKDQE